MVAICIAGALVAAAAVMKARMEYLTFQVPWDTGWHSITWRWQEGPYWYSMLPAPLFQAAQFGHSMVSDEYHVLRAARELSIVCAWWLPSMAALGLSWWWLLAAPAIAVMSGAIFSFAYHRGYGVPV